MSVFVSQSLADVQADHDTRGVPLDDVGISGLRYPVSVQLADGTKQQTICEAQLSVGLASTVRGTHMSRFVELLDENRNSISPASVLLFAQELATRLDAAEARVALTFPLFAQRVAPVSGQTALLAIECGLHARSGANGDHLQITARIPVTSLCPCSKKISDYSAHSQRGYVNISVVDGRWIDCEQGLWPEQLLSVCDQAASAPVYPILKRPDERHVTMLAYDRPAFVEDLARDVAVALQHDGRIAAFDVEVINQESIHDHEAFARLHWARS